MLPTRPVYKTKAQYCADIVLAFNSAATRIVWRARMGGTRVNPAVHFTSRSSMVTVTYLVNTEQFTINFKKTACSWGDFLGAAQRSLVVVLNSLQLAGMGFHTPISTALFRIEYNPRTKITSIAFILSEAEQAARTFLPSTVDEWYPNDNGHEYFKDGQEEIEDITKIPLDNDLTPG